MIPHLHQIKKMKKWLYETIMELLKSTNATRIYIFPDYSIIAIIHEVIYKAVTFQELSKAESATIYGTLNRKAKNKNAVIIQLSIGVYDDSIIDCAFLYTQDDLGLYFMGESFIISR